MPSVLPDEALLTVEEVATYLGVKSITVYRWCREGRLPALKPGREWRVRRTALDEFLRRAERQPTLVGQLRTFLTVPDHVIAVAATLDALHRLDAAFFQVAEARGGLLVKFTSGEHASPDALRAELVRHGLDVPTLEAAQRMVVVPEHDPLVQRATHLQQVLATHAAQAETVWASFDWTKQVSLDAAVKQQETLAAVVDAGQVVVKTGVLQEIADTWPDITERRVQHAHRGIIWMGQERMVLSRVTRMPSQ